MLFYLTHCLTSNFLSLSLSLSLLDILTACLIKSNHAVAKQGRVMQKDFVVFDISSSDVISSFVYSDVNGEIVCRLRVCLDRTYFAETEN